MQLGLQYDALVYNVFGMSVLSYICQLETPPQWALRLEEQALRLAASGPGGWAIPDDLWRLKEAFGMTISFKSVRAMARASQLRVFALEGAGCNGADLARRADDLRRLLQAPMQTRTKTQWEDWYKRSFILRIDDNRRDFEANICSIPQLMETILGTNQANNTAPKEERIRLLFQRTAYQLILRHNEPDPEFRMRHKLERWKLTDPCRHVCMRLQDLSARIRTPSWMSRKALHNLHLLGGLVAPRVVAACFSTLWNRWVTARRFQKRAHSDNYCQLGCGGEAEDAIEHYARCRLIREMGVRFLRLHAPEQISMHTFMLCNPHIRTREDLTCSAVLVYASYRATNHYRHVDTPPATTAYDALAQFAREGLRNHRASMTVIDQRWAATPASSPLPPIPAVLCQRRPLPQRRRERSNDAVGPTIRRPPKRRRSQENQEC
jgi:hypothetical protein